MNVKTSNVQRLESVGISGGVEVESESGISLAHGLGNGRLRCSPLLAPAFASDGVGQVAGTRAEKQERTDKKIHGHRRISGFHLRYSRLTGLKAFGELDL